jgi:hypothetical protein
MALLPTAELHPKMKKRRGDRECSSRELVGVPTHVAGRSSALRIPRIAVTNAIGKLVASANDILEGLWQAMEASTTACD